MGSSAAATLENVQYVWQDISTPLVSDTEHLILAQLQSIHQYKNKSLQSSWPTAQSRSYSRTVPARLRFERCCKELCGAEWRKELPKHEEAQLLKKYTLHEDDRE